jgi:hypothetical protein
MDSITIGGAGLDSKHNAFIKTFMMNDERETYIDTRPGPSNEDGIRLALIQAKLFARLKSPRPNSVCSSFA